MQQYCSRILISCCFESIDHRSTPPPPKNQNCKIKKVETDLNSSPRSSLILLPFRQQVGATTITPTTELLLLCHGFFFNCKHRQKINNNKRRTNPITQSKTNTKFSNKICSSLQICKFCTETKFSHKICSLQNCKFLTLWPTFPCDIPLFIFSTHITQSQAGVLKISDFQLELLRIVFFHNFNHFDNFWPNMCASQYTKKILLKLKRDPSNSSLVPEEVNKVQLLHEFWYELPNQSNHIYFSGSGVTYQMTICSQLLSEIQDQMKALICTSSTYLSIKGIVI